MLVVALGGLSIGTFLFAVGSGSSGTTAATASSGAGSSGAVPTAAAPTTTIAGSTETPAPADVAAARACQAWDTYLSAGLTGTVPSATGQALLTAAEALLAGAKQDQAAGRTLPKWTVLAGDILAGAQDVVNGDTEALQTDGAAVAAQCHMVPAAAAKAGGFVGS